MVRTRGATLLVSFCILLCVPLAVHAGGVCDASAYQGDEASGANQECPDVSSAYYYDSSQACGAQKKVNNQTLVNLYGKPCEKIEDNLLVKGICVAAKTCKGTQYQGTDGTWHDTTSKPFSNLSSSGVLGSTQEGTFGTPPSGSLSSAPTGSKSTPQPTFSGNSILDEAFNPTPIAQQNSSLTNSSVPDSFTALEQSSGNTSAPSDSSQSSESNWFNPTPLLDQSVGLSGGTLPPVESTPVQTTPIQGAPAVEPTGFTQANLSPAENEELVQQASTFSNASDCGWMCTIGGYADSAWNKTASAFDYLTNDVFTSPASAQPYNMESQDALRQASMLACKDQGCDGNFVAQALGGVCGQESQCNSEVSHGGSQYQGLGQLNVSETINAAENLSNLANSTNLTPDERAQVGDVVNQINDSLAAGQDPNKDPTLGSWLLVGRNMTLQDMGDAHPLEMVSQATDDPVRAGMILEAGQIAPTIYANGNVSDPSSGISSNVARALSDNSLDVSPGQSFNSVLNQMQSSSAFGTNIPTGAAWASPVPLPQPSPLAANTDVGSALSSTSWDPNFNYETAGSVPSESVPLPPENPLTVAANTMPQASTNVSWVDTQGSAPAGLSGGMPTESDVYGSGYGAPSTLSPTVPFNDSQVPTPDTTIPNGEEVTAAVQEQNNANAQPSATDLAREYADNLSNTGPDTSTGIQYSGGSPLPASYIESQIPTPDTSIPSGEAVTADVQAQINTDVQNQIVPDTNVPSGANVTADFQNANASPSLWQRLSSSVSDTWNSWFGSSATPVSIPPQTPPDSAMVPAPAVPYAPPRLTTSDILGTPAPSNPSPVLPVESTPLPPTTDSASEIPVPDTSVPSGEAVTAQILSGITAGIPTPDTSFAQEGPGSPTDLTHQYTSQIAAQERAQENAAIESQIPTPDTWVPSGQVITADVSAQAKAPSAESPTELAREYSASLTAQDSQAFFSQAFPPTYYGPQTQAEVEAAITAANQPALHVPSTNTGIPVPPTIVPSGPSVTQSIIADNTVHPPTQQGTPEAQPQAPIQQQPIRVPNQPASAPQLPGSRSWTPYYCITNLNPIIVAPISYGQYNPTGCYNRPGTPGSGYGLTAGNPFMSPLAVAAGSLIGSALTPANTQTAPINSQTVPTLTIGTAPAASSTVTSGTLIVHIVANPSVVALGSRAVISWSTINAIDCLIYTPGVAVFGSGANGSTTTDPIATTTVFAAKCAGLIDTVTASTTVTVQ